MHSADSPWGGHAALPVETRESPLLAPGASVTPQLLTWPGEQLTSSDHHELDFEWVSVPTTPQWGHLHIKILDVLCPSDWSAALAVGACPVAWSRSDASMRCSFAAPKGVLGQSYSNPLDLPRSQESTLLEESAWSPWALPDQDIFSTGQHAGAAHDYITSSASL